MSFEEALPPGYRLAQTSLRDMGAIHRLERVTFPLDFYDPLTLANVLLWPFNVNLKAVDSGGQLVGHVAGRANPLARVAWIITLAVAPSHQRRGIGRLLLSSCEKAMGRATVRLTVRASNTAAITLYEVTGYQQLRVWRRYYRGGEDGIVMEKQRVSNTE